jgi:hypothetical protein
MDEFWGYLLRRSIMSGGDCFEDDTITYPQLQLLLREYQMPDKLIAPVSSELWADCDRLVTEMNERFHRMYGHRRNDLFSVFKRFASPDGVTSVSITQGVFRDACFSELRMSTKHKSVNALFQFLGETEEGGVSGVSLYDISCLLKERFDVVSNRRQLSLMVKKNAEMDANKKRLKKRRSRKSLLSLSKAAAVNSRKN